MKEEGKREKGKVRVKVGGRGDNEKRRMGIKTEEEGDNGTKVRMEREKVSRVT